MLSSCHPGVRKNIARRLPQIQMGLAGRLQRFRVAHIILACLFQHSDPAAGAFVRKFLQFAVFLNRQAAVPIFGQLLLPIISSFASHAVLPLFRFVEEHTTLSDSNLDGVGWALTYEHPCLAFQWNGIFHLVRNHLGNERGVITGSAAD